MILLYRDNTTDTVGKQFFEMVAAIVKSIDFSKINISTQCSENIYVKRLHKKIQWLKLEPRK